MSTWCGTIDPFASVECIKPIVWRKVEMQGIASTMKALAAASPQENAASREQQQQVAAGRKGGGSDAVTSCVYCVGMSVYTKCVRCWLWVPRLVDLLSLTLLTTTQRVRCRAMLDQREPPHCKGLEIEVGAARERVDAFKRQARTFVWLHVIVDWLWLSESAAPHVRSV